MHGIVSILYPCWQYWTFFFKMCCFYVTLYVLELDEFLGIIHQNKNKELQEPSSDIFFVKIACNFLPLVIVFEGFTARPRDLFAPSLI